MIITEGDGILMCGFHAKISRAPPNPYPSFYQVVFLISRVHEEAGADKLRNWLKINCWVNLLQNQSLNIVLTSNIQHADEYPCFSFTISFILSRRTYSNSFQTSVSLQRSQSQFSNKVLSLIHLTVLWPVQEHLLLAVYWRIITQREYCCFFLFTCGVQGHRTFQD